MATGMQPCQQFRPSPASSGQRHHQYQQLLQYQQPELYGSMQVRMTRHPNTPSPLTQQTTGSSSRSRGASPSFRPSPFFADFKTAATSTATRLSEGVTADGYSYVVPANMAPYSSSSSPGGRFAMTPVGRVPEPPPLRGGVMRAATEATAVSPPANLRSVSVDDFVVTPVKSPHQQSLNYMLYRPGLPVQQQQLVSRKSVDDSAAGMVGILQQAQQQQLPTNFAARMKFTQPPLPVSLAQVALADAVPSSVPAGKIKVVIRISNVEPGAPTCLSVNAADSRQVVVHDPALTPSLSSTASNLLRHRVVSAAPRPFNFDRVLTPANSMNELCASCLDDVLQSVLAGSDGCVFTFGPSKVGKTYTMFGLDDPMSRDLGVIPTAISWLFQMISDRRDKTGARFSVRVSAVELTGRQEQLKDLLANVSTSPSSSSSGLSPTGDFSLPGSPAPPQLRDDAPSGSQLENVSEIRAPTAEAAALLLDAAIAARTIGESDDDVRQSHLLYTLHVYQYRVETTRPGQNSVTGGRSRLHFVDLGNCKRSRDTKTGSAAGNALSLTSLGNVIAAILSGQRQLPNRDSKLTQLMREALGGPSCNTCAIVHVNPASSYHNETAQVIQLASRIHRTKVRRRLKASSGSDGSSSGTSSSVQLSNWYCGSDSSHRRRAGVRMGVSSRRLAHSDPETSSCISGFSGGGHSSCDTVIHIGPENVNRMIHRPQYSDRDFTTDSETGSSVFTSVSAKSLPTSVASSEMTTLSGSKLSSRHRRRTPRASALPKYHPATIVEHPDEEQWIDGPRSCVPTSTSTTGGNISNGLVDKTDGPASRRSTTGGRNRQLPVAELWVDGPAEFQKHRPASAAESTSNVSGSTKDSIQFQSHIPTANHQSDDVPVAASKKSKLDSFPVSSSSTLPADCRYAIKNSLVSKIPSSDMNTRSLKAETSIRGKEKTSISSAKHSATSTPKRSPAPNKRSQLSQTRCPPDGRVAAWVQAVCDATVGPDTDSTVDIKPCSRDLYHPDGNEAVPDSVTEKAVSLSERLLPADVESVSKVCGDGGSSSSVTQEVSNKDDVDDLQCEDDDDKSASDAASGSGHSMYEAQLDECLETGSQCQIVVLSSDDDASVWGDATTPSDCCRRRVKDSPSDGVVALATDNDFSVGRPLCQRVDVSMLPTSTFAKSYSNVLVAAGCISGDRGSRSGSVVSRSREQCCPPVPKRSSSSPRQGTSATGPALSRCNNVLVARAEPGPEPVRSSKRDNSISIMSGTTVVRSSSAESRSKTNENRIVRFKKSSSAGRSPQTRRATYAGSDGMASPLPGFAREERRSRLPVAHSNSAVANCVCGPASSIGSPKMTSNVSGISLSKGRLLSPYHTVTSPQRARALTNSDNSSLLSDPVTVGSSGYGSMLHGDDPDDVMGDADAEDSSPTNPSLSSESCLESKSAERHRTDFKSEKRSRTKLPVYSSSSSLACSRSLPVRTSDCPTTLLPNSVWREKSTYSFQDDMDDYKNSLNSAMSNEKERERGGGSGHVLTLDAEALVALKRIQRADELRERRRQLSVDTAALQNLLGIKERNTSVSNETSTDDGMDRSDPEYIKLLESETAILERRLRAFQSRVMLVTCFDAVV